MIAWSVSFINSGRRAGLPRAVYREHLAWITSLGTCSRVTPLTARRPLVSVRLLCWVVIS